jgi:hypothetical protein
VSGVAELAGVGLNTGACFGVFSVCGPIKKSKNATRTTNEKKNEKNDPNRRSSGGDPIRGCLEYPHRIPLSGVSVFTRRALPCRVQQRKTFQLTPPPPSSCIVSHATSRQLHRRVSKKRQAQRAWPHILSDAVVRRQPEQ